MDAITQHNLKLLSGQRRTFRQRYYHSRKKIINTIFASVCWLCNLYDYLLCDYIIQNKNQQSNLTFRLLSLQLVYWWCHCGRQIKGPKIKRSYVLCITQFLGYQDYFYMFHIKWSDLFYYCWIVWRMMFF